MEKKMRRLNSNQPPDEPSGKILRTGEKKTRKKLGNSLLLGGPERVS